MLRWPFDPFSMDVPWFNACSSWQANAIAAMVDITHLQRHFRPEASPKAPASGCTWLQICVYPLEVHILYDNRLCLFLSFDETRFMYIAQLT